MEPRLVVLHKEQVYLINNEHLILPLPLAVTELPPVTMP
jgi:hypothetical protein